MKRRGIPWLALALLLTLGAGLIADRPPLWESTAQPGAGLTDLDNIDHLRAQFNADAGMVRLILVLSPT